METDILKNRYALVTGGSQGLGEAICYSLASAGCAGIAVCDITLEKTETVVRNLREKWGIESIGIHMDVTSERGKHGVEPGFKEYSRHLARLDILVSNAGILMSGEVDDFPGKNWKKVIDVNLYGYFLVAKYAVKIMKRQRSGNIIQINSKSGKKGSYKNSAYVASKFGGIGLTQSLALELAEYGIRVNSLCPGNLLDSPLWVNSLYRQYAGRWRISESEVRKKYIDQVPLKRGCTYDDVTNLLIFLASDNASYMTGQAINVTGGQEMH